MSTRQMERMAAEAKHSAAATLQGVIDSAEEFLDGLSAQQGEAVERLRENIEGEIERAREQLCALDVEQVATSTVANTVGFVRRDPWRAVAIGALAVVAALVLRPRWS
jgi:ElaB/YqjD/DUF883 family membrane-anchored ribosome-binding protein